MDIRTVLEYSPYDNKRITPFGDQGDTEKGKKYFMDNFFVDYPKPTKDILELELQNTINGIDGTILFYGASGSGKTTFLNYFADSHSNDFFFHFVNLIEKPSPADHERCIRTAILSKLCKILDDEANGVAQRLYDEIVVQDSFLPFDREEDNDLFIDYLVETLQRPKKAEMALNSIGVLDNDNNHLATNCNEGLLKLYILSELLRSNNEINGNEKHVFIFDNLDEIPTHYITSHTYQLILSVYSSIQKYCEEYSEYEFLRNCTFVLSYRSTNAQIVDDAQHQERVLMSTKKIEFKSEYQVSYAEILNRRIEYYWKHESDTSKKSSIDNIVALLNTESEYCTKALRPLFNYDFRMYTTLFIIHLLYKDFAHLDNKIIKSDSYDIRNDSEEQTGARGILLFNALESMLSHTSSRFANYVRHEFEDESLCNVYRMSFTLLSNLGGWSMRDDIELLKAIRDENDFTDSNPRITLSKVVKRIEKWYGRELVSTVIEGLVGSAAYNYEYPVVLLGTKIDEYYGNPTNTHSTSGLANYIINLYNENDAFLSTIFVKINPLCVLYAWRVFISFEYFNLISTKWDCKKISESKYSPVPLFQINSEYMLKTCLSSTFLTVKHVLRMADKHFCDKCVTSKRALCKYKKEKKGSEIQKKTDVGSSTSTCNESFNDFIEDGFCIQNSLYATRLITSHLNYLDRYRKYAKERENEKPDKKKAIQQIVIEQMSEYIKYWEERRIVTTSQNLQDTYLLKVENAIKMEQIDSVVSYNNLGSVYFDRKDYKKALEYYYLVLSIRENQLGKDHLDIASSLFNIGMAYYNQEDYENARDYLNRCYLIRDKKLGESNSETKGTLEILNAVMKRLNDKN